jgi:hypothetical protein
MVDLGHEKAVTCDVTFETNDNKVLSLIFPQCLIFSGRPSFLDQHGLPS